MIKLTLLLLSICVSAACAADASADAEVFRAVLRKSGDEGVHTYRIPGLAVTAKGTLIAVFDIRHNSAVDLPADIDVGMLRSTDNGTTWSKMSAILNFDKTVANSRGNGVGDPCILVDSQSNTIIVSALRSKGNRSWHGSGPGLTEDETGQLVLTRSTDDGLTWSAPESITPQVKDPAWRILFQGPGSGIQLKDGTLVMPAQFKAADNVPHSCFLFSADHGKTWKISKPAIPNQPPTSEAQIVELADGSLFLSMRDESHSGKRAWAKYTWKGTLEAGAWGEHWSLLPDPTCMASIVRHPDGKLIFSNPNHATKRMALTVRTSADDGNSWTEGRVLEPGGAMYSSLAVLGNGNIGILYEGPGNALVFARFSLAWLQNKL